MADPEEEARRYIHGVFCEDVREEVGGTISLIGVFQTPAVNPSSPYPVMFPKLAIVFWVVCPISENLPDLELFLETPDGAETPIAMPPIATPTQENIPGSTRRIATGTIRVLSLAISKPGYLRLKIRAWGKVWTSASLVLTDSVVAASAAPGPTKN